MSTSDDSKGWGSIYVQYDKHLRTQTAETKPGIVPRFKWMDHLNRGAVVSALVGALVIVIALVIARPSVILVEPDCMYATPHINLLSVAAVFVVVAGTLFMIEANHPIPR